MVVGLFAVCCFEPVDGDRVFVAVHVEHVVFVMNLKDLEWPIGGALQWAAGSIVANLHNWWKAGYWGCKQSACRGAHVWVAGRSAFCLGAGRGTWRMLAHSVVHEGGTPRGCGGKCYT